MKVTYILDEDFINYRKPSMFIGTSKCSGKCYKELNLPCDICQNNELTKHEIIDIPDDEICEKYLNNHLTSAIVFGGLEPFDQFDEMFTLIDILRNRYNCHDDIVIYTGYIWSEVDEEVNKLKEFDNIIIKFGRYIPGRSMVNDPVLGVRLASDNQFAVMFNKRTDQ